MPNISDDLSLSLSDPYKKLIDAIASKKLETVEEILLSLQDHPDILCQVLKQVDKNNFSALYSAILVDNSEITEKILSSLQTHPDILQEVLMQENNYCNSVLDYAIFKENLHIVEKILSSLQTHPDILKEVLMQKDNYGNSVLIQAIDLQKPEIVEKILSSLQTHPDILKEVLMRKSASGDKALFKAIQNVVANNNYENTNPEEILRSLVQNQFKINLSQLQISALTSFYKNHALLALMSQDRYGIGSQENPHLLTKILNEVVASSEFESLKNNPISQIYAKEISNVNSNQAVPILQNQDLYIYKSNVLQHNSYVIFKVDRVNNKVKSISYCDGNFFSTLGDARPNRLLRLFGRRVCYGVREFELKEDHTFSTEFAQEFISKNFQGKDIESLQLPFMVGLQQLGIKKTIFSVKTKQQLRGNCAFKSANILARYLLQEKTGKRYSRDYQQFKKELRSQVVQGLVKDYEKIKEQFGEEFVKHLEIKERLKEVAGEKFGKKQSGLFKTAISAIEGINAGPKLIPNTSIIVNSISRLVKRIFLSKTN